MVRKIEKQNIIDAVPLKNQCIKLKKELDKINDKKLAVIESEYQNKIDINTLNQRLAFLEEKELKINKKINSFEKEISNPDSQIKVNPDIIREILKNFKLLFEKADVATKKLLLQSIIESIIVINGKSAWNRVLDKMVV